MTKLENHFKNQGTCQSINVEFKKHIDMELENIENYIKYAEETDCPITCSEVNTILNKIKTGKSSGPDKILNEVIKYSKPIILNAYTKLFNIILKTGCYPKSWEQSYIIAIHKSGDKTNLNNYRGIALMNCLSKIFSAILNARLKNFMGDKYNNSQFGFRENHRTSDSLFILKSLINKYLHKNKRKIYVCFVDLQKAFDSLWRTGLLYKLAKLGIGKNMYTIIKKQFENTLGSFKYQNMQSDFFQINKGVRQGDAISPTLFNIFINDMSRIFEYDCNDPLKLIDTKIGSLLFADDLIILSESETGLQNSLNNLSNYCDKWHLTVNVQKTKTLVFQNSCCKLQKPFIRFKNNYLENVKEYKFLGSLITSNGSLVNSSLELSKKARKVMFSIKAYTSDFGQLPVKVACNLFDTLVKPILTYNSEICFMDSYLKLFRAKLRAQKSHTILDECNFIDKNALEKVHLSFCKNILGTKKSSTNLGVRSELGRIPIESFIKSQTTLYLLRLNNDNLNPLLKEAFNLTKKLDEENIYSWYTYAKNVANEIDFDTESTVTCTNLKEINRYKPIINNNIKDYYNGLISNKIRNLTENNKIHLYKILKQNENEMEYYLSHPDKNIRQYFVKFRISEHKLLIEKGRYLKIPRNKRLCTNCNEIDNEFHFFFNCEINNSVRNMLYQSMTDFFPNFIDLNNEEKLIKILNPSTPMQIRTVASFIKQSLELREGDPIQS